MHNPYFLHFSANLVTPEIWRADSEGDILRTICCKWLQWSIPVRNNALNICFSRCRGRRAWGRSWGRGRRDYLALLSVCNGRHNSSGSQCIAVLSRESNIQSTFSDCGCWECISKHGRACRSCDSFEDCWTRSSVRAWGVANFIQRHNRCDCHSLGSQRGCYDACIWDRKCVWFWCSCRSNSGTASWIEWFLSLLKVYSSPVIKMESSMTEPSCFCWDAQHRKK